jgi:dTDP-glucose pyrophosphorylase
MRERGLDGSILVFDCPERDPKWSCAETDDSGHFVRVAEKDPISRLATVGVHLYASGAVLVDSIVEMIVRNDRTNGEFYTCPAYNHAIASGHRIGVYEVPREAMHGLGTPEDLEAYLGALAR